MTSLRARLSALWFLLVGSACVTGLLLYEFYARSAAGQLSQTEVEVTRSCRDIAERYAFYVSGWSGPGAAGIDDALRRDLSGVVTAALLRAAGVEGGLWSERAGSLAYAYPTYEGTGPKTDLPSAELSTIAQVNADALRDGRPRTLVREGRSQTLVVQACPVGGPLRDATAWAMARVFTGQGEAYGRLLLGLAVLAATVLGSALFLGRILLTNARRIAGLEAALAARASGDALPILAPTGERDLDRLVAALNEAGRRLAEARSRLVAAERLAALGRLAAGIAHEIRNPMAAMRLKAENALAAGDPARDRAALGAVLGQIERLDRLLGDLLGLTQPRAPARGPTDVARLLSETVQLHAESAAAEGIELRIVSALAPESRPVVDGEQIGRAVSNLVLNAIQSLAGRPGGTVMVEAARVAGPSGDRLVIGVRDDGPGVPVAQRERIFEPFETTKASGSGLGLSIVREIARGHGGEVRLVASPTGAHFELDLPWAPS